MARQIRNENIIYARVFSGVEVPRAIHQIANILAGKMAGIAITKAPPPEHEDFGAGARSNVESYRYLSQRNPPKFAMSAREMG